MSNQYYQLSTDYDLANRILKEGGSIIQQAKNDFSGFFVITNSAGLGDNFDYLKESNTQFLLPIPDPTYELKTDLAEVRQQCSKLQHSLKLALDECDSYKSMLDGVNEACVRRREKIDELQTKVAEIESENTTLWRIACGFEDQLDKCETQNNLANEALSAIAEHLGFESFTNDEVVIAIENLLATKACNEVKDREIKILQETLERTNSLHETQIHRRNIASQAQIESINALREQRDNLKQSHGNRLSELTNIMRMVQALEDIPQDKVDGAIYLIKRVLYDSICKLDPSQSWDA